jgi:hypothetical protein
MTNPTRAEQNFLLPISLSGLSLCFLHLGYKNYLGVMSNFNLYNTIEPCIIDKLVAAVAGPAIVKLFC